MDKLQNFYVDEVMREEVFNFFLAYLDRLALAKVYKKEDVSGIADAKECLLGARNALYAKYGKPERSNPQNSPI